MAVTPVLPRRGVPRREKLTKSRVEALEPEPREYQIYDTEQPGLYVRVRPGGAKSYGVAYRNAHGKLKRVTIGPTSRWPVRDARRRAAEIRVGADKGEDVQARKVKARGVGTYGELVDAFVKAEGSGWRESTASDFATLRAKYLLPELGNAPLPEISVERCEELHARVTKSAGPRQANKVLSRLSTHLRWALKRRDRWGIESNPASLVRRHRENHREVRLTTADRRKLISALEYADSNTPPQVAAALRFILYTGVRHQECLRLRWDDLDPEAGQMMVRESKRDTPHRPLSPMAWSVVDALERRSEWVFSSPRFPEKRISNLKAWWGPIRAEFNVTCRVNGKPGLLRIHDFRHLVGGMLARMGETSMTIGHMLGHKDDQTARLYVAAAERADVVPEKLDDAMSALLGD